MVAIFVYFGVTIDFVDEEDLVVHAGITSGSNSESKLHEGVLSTFVTPGPADVEFIHLDAEDIGVETSFMLIDLSDTTNWPHTNTGHIDVVFAAVNIAPDTNYQGDLQIGFLTGVTATTGNLNGIYELHMDKKTALIATTIPLPFGGVSLETEHWFGPTSASAAFQTDVNLAGPDETTTFPSGNGDLVMTITRTAGEVSVGVTIGYITQE